MYVCISSMLFLSNFLMDPRARLLVGLLICPEFSKKKGKSPASHMLQIYYRVFIKNCVFFLKILLFFFSSSAALVFYMPGVCTHTDTEGKQGKVRVWNILKNSEKTQYLINTL